MVVCIRELLLLQGYVSETPPCIVMGLICLECVLVALLSVFKVFVGYELVPAESMCIGEVLIQLDSSSEEFQGRLVLLLQTVAIPNNAPGLRREQ